MATPDATIRIGQVGLEQDIQRAIQRVNSKGGLNVKLNSRSFTQPLGKITASADEFTKSIEASNARVIAFGASVGIINAITGAFKNLITETVALEKRLTEVNVVLGANSSQLDSFGKQLFNVARNTAQSFDVVSEAALEFSRQGLTMEETLKRTQDALILTRLTGLKAADSVKGLTATINSFATAGLNTAEIISKLAAVDVQFAVSSEDLINALSRAGAVAQDAGLDFDQLVAAVTSAQQITARGGAVIGNSFKTIFTRIQRADTLDRLQELGIAVRDVRGETLPAMMILQQLASTYDSLSDATKSAVAEQVGGVFQINVLKAALKDLSSENSIYQRAVVTSAGATDEAIRKNDQLNQTLAALGAQTLVSIKELSAAVGEITVGPGIEKVLNMVNDLTQGAAKLLDGEGIGSNLANGILKGIGTIISGPGLVIIGGLIGKLFVDVTVFAAKSFKNIVGLNKGAQQQKALQDSIFNTLQSNERINRVLAQLEGNKAAQAKFLFDEVSRTTTEYNKQLGLANQLASTLGKMGVISGPAGLTLGGRRGRSQNAARGFIPNYSIDPVTREAMDVSLGVGGVTKSAKPVTLKNFNTGKGIVDMVANTQEVYVKNFDGKGGDAVFNPDMMRQFGVPEGARKISAARGFIPNYAFLKPDEEISSDSAKRKGNPLFGKNLSQAVDAFRQGEIPGPNPRVSLTSVWGKQAVDNLLGPNQKETAKRKRASTKGKRPVNLTFDGRPYGVVIPQAGENGNVNMSVPQSEIFDKAPFPRGSTITAKRVGVARLDKGSSYQKALKAEMTRAIDGIARSLLPGGGDADFKSTDFQKFLDKSAKPQFLGRTFELALQYVTQKTVDHLKGGERFDFKNGLPERIDEVFGLKGKGARNRKWDAKISATSKPSQSSMLEKIMLEEYGLPSKRGLASKVIKDKSRQITAAQGFLPNISIKASDLPALQDSIGRERAAGIPNFAIRVNRSPRLKTPSNPSGLAVTNTIDEPAGLSDVFRQRRIMTAARGFVPNFAAFMGVPDVPSAGAAVDNIGKMNLKQTEVALEGVNEKLEQFNKYIEDAVFEADSTADQIRRQNDLLKNSNAEYQTLDAQLNEDIQLKEKESALRGKITAEIQQIQEAEARGKKGSKASAKRLERIDLLLAEREKLSKSLDATGHRIKDREERRARLARNIADEDQITLKLKDDLNEIQKRVNKAEEKRARVASDQSTLANRQGQIRDRRATMAQTAGIGFSVGVPMLIGALENAVFKGMSRVEMTSTQRGQQGALQGVMGATSFLGFLAPLLPGGIVVKALTSAAVIVGAAGLGFQKAAQLTLDEVKQKAEETRSANSAELQAAEEVLRARSVLDDQSGRSSEEIAKASQSLSDNFAKIRDVKLRDSLLGTTFSFNEAQKAVSQFSKTIGGEGALAAVGIAFKELEENSKDATQGMANSVKAANALAGLVTLSEEGRKGLAELIEVTKEDVKNTKGKRVRRVEATGDGEFVDTTINTLVSNAIANKHFIDTMFKPFEKALQEDGMDETLVKSTIQGIRQDFLRTLTDNVKKGGLQETGVQITLAFLETLDTAIKQQNNVTEVTKAGAIISSKLNEIRQTTNKVIRDSLTQTQEDIAAVKFDLKITDQIEKFRQNITKNILPVQDFEGSVADANVLKFEKEFQNNRNQIVAKNLESISKGFREVFEKSDLGGTVSQRLIEGFKQSPEEGIKSILGFLDSSTNAIDESRKVFQEAKDEEIKKLKNLKKDVDKFSGQKVDTDFKEKFGQDIQGLAINADVSDVVEKIDAEIEAIKESKVKTFSDLSSEQQKEAEKLKALAETIGANLAIERNNLQERTTLEKIRSATVQIEKELLNDAKDVASKTSAVVADMSLALRSSAIEFRRDMTEIDLEINDPRRALSGIEEVRRRAALQDKKIDREHEFELRKINKENQIQQQKIAANTQFVTALGTNTKSLDKVSETIMQLAGVLASDQIPEEEKRLDSIKQESKELEKRIAAADDLLNNATLKTASQAVVKRSADLMSINKALNETYTGSQITMSEDGITRKSTVFGSVTKDSNMDEQERALLIAEQTKATDALILAKQELHKLETAHSQRTADKEKLNVLQGQKRVIEKNRNLMRELADTNAFDQKKLSNNLSTLNKFSANSDFANNTKSIEAYRKSLSKAIDEAKEKGELDRQLSEDTKRNFIDQQVQQQKLILLAKAEADEAKRDKKIKNEAELENKEFENSFEGGQKAFRDNVNSSISGFGRRLGEDVPTAFRDGMTNALSAVINRTDNLRDALLGIANSFLQTIQQAFLQQASNRLVSSLGIGGFYNGGAVKKYATGGYVGNSGKVPAMLTNGEYVMSREAVQRMGVGGMEKLNKGTLSVAGFASGGQVSNKARKAYSKHMNTFGTSFNGSKSARFFGEFWQNVPKAQREVSLQAAADQEAQAEAQAKQAKKKQLMSTIIGLAASAALAFGTSRLMKNADLSRFKKGNLTTIGTSSGQITGRVTNGQFVPSSSQNQELSLSDFENIDMLNSRADSVGGWNKFSLGDLKSSGITLKSVNNKFNGGMIQKYAGGGQVRGPAGRDVIPAVLTEGEYVIKASSARKYGKRFLDNLNYGSQGYYNGGATGPMPAGGSQNFNLNMNFDVAGGQTESQQGQSQGNGQGGQDQNINQFAQNIRRLVQEEIQKEQRAGGLLRGTRR